jgi:hypothetical protein
MLRCEVYFVGAFFLSLCFCDSFSFSLFESNSHSQLVLVSMGQILNALSGPIGMGGAVVISSLWFPQSERIISTAIMVGSSMSRYFFLLVIFS